MKYFLLLSLFILSACSDVQSNDSSVRLDQNADGIIGGRVVKPMDVIASRVLMVVSYNASGRTNLCTGTPIKEDVILTAAHCVQNAVKVKVAFGLNIVDVQNNPVIQASSFKFNTDYDENHDQYDLALVRLPRPIPSNYSVSKIYDGTQEITSETVTLAGYGITSSNGNDAGILRITTKSLKNITVQRDSILITQQSYNGVCSGDSGGPLFVQVGSELQLYGVNSYVEGTESNPCGYTSGAVYVKSQMTWIQNTLKEL